MYQNLDSSSLHLTSNSIAYDSILQTVFEESLAKSPLRQLSFIDQQHSQIRRTDNIPSQTIKSKQVNIFKSLPSFETKDSLASNMGKSQGSLLIIALTNLSTHETIPLIKQSLFSCCSVSNSRLQCFYHFQGQSTLEIQMNKVQSQQKQLIFALNFDTVSAQIKYDNDIASQQVIIIIGKYELTLEVQQPDADNFKRRLKRAHKIGRGSEIPLHLLQQTEQFYKRRYETQQYFVNNCSTGDLLLFQDNHFFAKLQRFFTGSEVNHVGMIIKDERYGILIFESNSKSGVCLTQWKSFILYGWYQYIPKITWRRLTKVDRDYEFENIIVNFMKESISTSFDISARIFLAQQSVIISSPHELDLLEKEEHQRSKGYFCSELIATLYKNLGFLTRDRNNSNYQPACKFYPKDFSELSGRKLDKGSLSPEYQIHFDPNLLRENYPTYIQQNLLNPEK